MINLVAPGIYRSPQPRCKADFAEIIDLGIDFVIDLENEWHEAAWEHEKCIAAGLSFTSVPMSAFFPPDQTQVDFILASITRDSSRNVLVHCRHGQDRTGLIVGLYRIHHQGWKRWAAWCEMLDSGYHPCLIGLTCYFWLDAVRLGRGDVAPSHC